MTPKQKAEELIQSYVNLNVFPYYGRIDVYAKQCALICVDEILQESFIWSNIVDTRTYWLEVKKQRPDHK